MLEHVFNTESSNNLQVKISIFCNFVIFLHKTKLHKMDINNKKVQKISP